MWADSWWLHRAGWTQHPSKGIVGKSGAGFAWQPAESIRPQVYDKSLAPPGALRDPASDASSIDGSVVAEDEEEQVHNNLIIALTQRDRSPAWGGSLCCFWSTALNSGCTALM